MKPWFDQTVHQNPQEFGRRVVVCAVDPDKGVPGVGGLLEVARDFKKIKIEPFTTAQLIIYARS
jgi:hypothetical protein